MFSGIFLFFVAIINLCHCSYGGGYGVSSANGHSYGYGQSSKTNHYGYAPGPYNQQTSSSNGFGSVGVCATPTVLNGRVKCQGTWNSLLCRAECENGYQFPFNKKHRYIKCKDGTYSTPQEPDQPLETPCEAICLPPCQNEGNCYAPDQCSCREGFEGPLCQYRSGPPCPPVLEAPANTQIKCNSQSCTVECLNGHEFPDTTVQSSLTCQNGRWVPDRPDWDAVPDCRPVCTPPCRNGGRCISRDVCGCTDDFAGPQCQYPKAACSIEKLGFKGSVRCTGDGIALRCTIQCPPNARFISPPAPYYECLYELGVFQPQPTPKCDYGLVTQAKQPPWSHNFPGLLNASESPQQVTSSMAPDIAMTSGKCITWSGAHYQTFDGEVYSFQSRCRHILVRDASEQRRYVVMLQWPCADTNCSGRIDVFLDLDEYSLVKDETGEIKLKTKVGDLQLPVSKPGISVTLEGKSVLAKLTELDLTIKWDTNQLVQVEAAASLWGRTEGLCGVLDGRNETDMQVNRRPTKNIDKLAQYWSVENMNEVCNEVPQTRGVCSKKSITIANDAAKFCDKIFNDTKFEKCQFYASKFREACLWDYCHCAPDNDPELCACSTISMFAQQCINSGVAELINWRDQNTCPIKCGAGKVYMSCRPAAQETCAGPVVAMDGSCVEGCFCPEGQVLRGDDCVDRSECPCRYGDRLLETGRVIQKECNECKCVSGAWDCTTRKCGARCTAIGDPHYTTFDGTRYDFMGKCSYHLLQTDNFTVDVENVPCSGAISEAMNLATLRSGRDMPSCTKAVTINYGGIVIKLGQHGQITVNGNEINAIPAVINDIVIRPASSLFIIVELPTGVDIFWDTATRVMVEVPASFREKTKGLCGTFNDNQKDDFLTPEGDVEQAVNPFVNKWKTREMCADLSDGEPPSTCRLFPNNKQLATVHCSLLKSPPFDECHSFVDVTSFYEACMYDMCACENNAADCLCPVLGAYADECAKMGVKVEWRNFINVCGIQCTGGQTYQVCADSCARTCTDVSGHFRTRSTCESKCVEGCACPVGQVLSADGECVAPASCPCHYNGEEFRPSEKMMRDGKTGKKVCVCSSARWKCRNATESDIVPSSKPDQCSADENLEFTTCEPAVPRTCKNMHLPEQYSTAVCEPGCQCKAGYVLEGVSRKCVRPDQCPCHHGGRSYPDGHVIPEECNTCECRKGKWECTKRQCSGMCNVWGDSHFTTFDGRNFEFQGVCSYLMARGVDRDRSFSVELENDLCGTTGATCVKSITLKTNAGTKNESMTLIKNNPIPKSTGLESIEIYEAGAFVFLDVSSLDILLQWDKATRVSLRVSPKWKLRMNGLCGNYDNDERDDMTDSASSLEASVLAFVDSYRLSSACLSATPVKDYCEERPHRRDWALTSCGALLQAPFTECHSEVPPGDYLKRCERDACACDSGGDCQCICIALATYAQLCAARGVVFKWRSMELCPCQCDEETTAYEPCMSACPEESCENTLFYDGIKKGCSENTCIEGCRVKEKCPKELVFANSSLSACVPRTQCSVPCMTLPDGRIALEGELLEEDACHQCHCSRKQRICKGQPCSTPQPRSLTRSNHETRTKTTSPFVMVHNDDCKAGWSKWLNNAVVETYISLGANATIEYEELPNTLQMANSDGLGVCKATMMKEIECRTVGEHKNYTEVKLATACSLDRGFTCRSSPGKVCSDFEIRVRCDCDDVEVPQNQIKYPQCSDPSAHPNHEHPTDCHKFYQCVPGTGPIEHPNLVEQTCGGDMWYNPDTMTCDWSENVKPLRPFCSNRKPLQTTTTSKSTGQIDSWCEIDEVWSECAIECDKLCHGYIKQVQNVGICLSGKECEAGCVPQILDNKCAPGQLRRDRERCLDKRDCTCLSNNGTIVKPGGVVYEDDCSKCQCLENVYSCDKSGCASTTPANELPPSQPTTPPAFVVTTTVTPLPACDPDRFKYLVWGGDTVNAQVTASSRKNENFGPLSAALKKLVKGGAWSPNDSDLKPYLQVEFGRREPLYGVVMQGSAIFSEFVNTYGVMYSDDGISWSDVASVEGTFYGPTSATETKQQFFAHPVEAKFLRIFPQSFHEQIAVRFDLIGCDEVNSSPEYPVTTTPSPLMTKLDIMRCDEPMGFGNGLPEKYVQVSSEKETVRNLDINQPIAWRPTYSTLGEWIFFDFTGSRNITGVITKGGRNGWVKTYKLMYAPEMKEGEHFKSWNFITDDDGSDKVFVANFDSDTPAKIMFPRPIRMRYLKLLPETWYRDNMELRVEPVGCYEAYPPVPTTPPANPLAREPECQSCPGLAKVEMEDCFCKDIDSYYNGEGCVQREKCPCYVGFITYAVGSSYKSSNCEDCTCKMGGVPDCKPTKCPPCGEGEVRKRDECTCSCGPCPSGERACRSTSTCVPESRWCDGVIDCGDDESDCPHLNTLDPSTVTPPTTKAPIVCPPVECADGYKAVLQKAKNPLYRSQTTSALTSSDSPLNGSLFIPPLPPPRKSYTKFQKTKGANKVPVKYAGTKTRPIRIRPQNQFVFPTAPKPKIHQIMTEECPNYICVPHLGQDVCMIPECPPNYKLHMQKSEKKGCSTYTCMPPPMADANCTLSGRTITTFDGTEYKYDMCSHLLARDAHEDKWSVVVEKNCSLASGCSKELVVTQDADEIRLLPTLQVEFNGRPYTIDQTAMIGAEMETFFISRNGDIIFLVSKKYLFWITYSAKGEIRIGVKGDLAKSVDGMCGYFDGSPDNDRRLPNGTIVVSTERFAEAWTKQDLPPDACESRICPLKLQEKAYRMCNAVSKNVLSTCNRVLDLKKWRTLCLEKVCECVQKRDAPVIDRRIAESDNFDECLCEALQTFAVECMTADSSIDLQGWRTENNCPADCMSPLVRHDCHRRRCEPTCGGNNACARADGICFPGCFCPEGKLRRGNDCVTPDQCRDCVCDGKGTPAKYTTFERSDLPFSGNCTYIAARDKSSNGDYTFEVYVTNGACKQDSSSVCVEALHIATGIHKIHVKKDNSSSQLQVTVDGAPVYNSVSNDWLELKMVPGKDLSIFILDAKLEIKSVLTNMDFSVQLPSSVYANKTEGLCGVCGGAAVEALVMQNGKTTTDLKEYGLSWLADKDSLQKMDIAVQERCTEKSPSKCLPPPPDQDPCLKMFDATAFGSCHPVVDPIPFVSACQQDLCGTGRELGACSELERYATECRRAGLCVQWRNEDFCPYKCEGELKYRPCGLGCQLTCDNFADLSKHPQTCETQNTEGCFCPEGKVLVNNSCIEPGKCFPCDAAGQHFAGDEWQMDVCTKCSCFKSNASGEAAIVSCFKTQCVNKACGPGETAHKLTAKPGECCPQVECVPEQKNPNATCELPQSIKCGVDQIVKVEENANGCHVRVCRCIERSECGPLSPPVGPGAPGMVVHNDTSRCCPRAEWVCDVTTCPPPPACPQFHDLVVTKGECCKEYTCALPKDKCVVKLEWESKPEGGESRRQSPQTVVKTIGEVWTDGACHACKCTAGGVKCAQTACPPVLTSDSLVVEQRTPPHACCPQPAFVACKHHDRIFQVGENITSATDPCESYECVRVNENVIEKRTTRQQCNTDCKVGWLYSTAEMEEHTCCGECVAIACVVGEIAHPVDSVWKSDDACTTNKCVKNGTYVLMQSEAKACEYPSEETFKNFVVKQSKVEGECCPQYELTACEYNHTVYKEGATWQPSTEPCVTLTCSRDPSGKLTYARSIITCPTCERGFELRAPEAGQCCGQCVPSACVDGDVLKPIGSNWTSEDKCANFTCSLSGGAASVSMFLESCPDVTDCPSERIYTKGCCKFCREETKSQISESECRVQVLNGTAATRVVEFHLKGGLCTNTKPLAGFTRCKGGCPSHTVYNKITGAHDAHCECCRATKLTTIRVDMECPDGHVIPHQIAVPAACDCTQCGGP